MQGTQVCYFWGQSLSRDCWSVTLQKWMGAQSCQGGAGPCPMWHSTNALKTN
jgi:hypothetical protein